MKIDAEGHISENTKGERSNQDPQESKSQCLSVQVLPVQREEEVSGQEGCEASTRWSVNRGMAARETIARAASKHRHCFISAFSFQDILAH